VSCCDPEWGDSKGDNNLVVGGRVRMHMRTGPRKGCKVWVRSIGAYNHDFGQLAIACHEPLDRTDSRTGMSSYKSYDRK
jgi:hypothetical protein